MRQSFAPIVFVYTVGKTMRRIENCLTPLVTVAANLSIKYLLLLVVLL